MRKLLAITQVSLDGVMQGPGGPQEDPSGGFTQGGWAMPFGDAASGRVLGELIASEFDLLLGRRTYDIWASYWPDHDDNPIGNAFNRVTKFVVTHHPSHLRWKTSQPIGGDVAAEIRRLKCSDGPTLQLWGSGQVLQLLIAAGLVDEHRLWVIPVILGRGKRLFEQGVPPASFSLMSTEATSRGVLFNTYRPAGPIPPA